MRSWIWDTDDEQDVWAVPNTVTQIWVTMCGAGTAGGNGPAVTGSPLRGGSGGSASPAVVRFPLLVSPGGAIALRVASPATHGQDIGNNSYKTFSALVGQALLSQCCKRLGFCNYFQVGWGGPGIDNSNTGAGSWFYVGEDTNHMRYIDPTAAVAPVWQWSKGGLPAMYTAPFVTGDGSNTGPGNPYSYGVSGMQTLGGLNGMGLAYASDATNGSGGPGGGGLFGRGGDGGVYPGHQNGYDATGRGAGGGGGAPGGTGGAATGGLIIIECH